MGLASAFSKIGPSKRADLEAILVDPEFDAAIRGIVRDVLIRELVPSYLSDATIPPWSILPKKADGTTPAPGATLKYDAVNDRIDF